MVFHKTHGMNQPLFSMRTLYVSRTPADSSVYPTISAALDAIPMDLNEPACIYLAPGIYHEKITINKPYLTILGTGKSNKDVVLTYDDYALAPMADIGKLGTFRSYSVFIDTHDVTLQNLTIENASGDSLTHGQAIALYADGDRLVIDSCRLIGHQDTLFTGPLPPKEIEPDGFIGPKQFAPRINGRQYYKNCYICGDIDFIFGSATAYFENCVTQGFYHAVFKISSGTSKNKINVATNITVLIILSAVDPWGKLFWTDKTVRLDLFWRKRSGEKGILMSNQTAGINHKPVTIGIERDCLSVCERIARCIFNCEILQCDVMRINENRVGAESSEFSNISHGSKGVIIISQDDIFI